jgi:hypothetical protein
MLCDIEVQDASTIMTDDEEAIERAEGDRRNSEEVHRSNRFPGITEKGKPALGRLRIASCPFHPTQTHRILFLRLNPGIYLELGGLVLSDNLELVGKPKAKTASSIAWQTERPCSSMVSRTLDTLMANPTLSAILVVWFTKQGRTYVLVLVRKGEAQRTRLTVTVPTRSRS